jgi:hypothetical protein
VKEEGRKKVREAKLKRKCVFRAASLSLFFCTFVFDHFQTASSLRRVSLSLKESAPLLHK